MGKMGYFIKKIRESKDMTQKELAEGILSESQLSKYEREETDTTEVTFLALLRRMNVSFAEFETLYMKEEDTQQKFIDKFRRAMRKDDIILLNQLKEEESGKFKKDKNVCHQHNEILVTCYINKLSQLKNDKRQLQKIVTYLNSVEDWGRYEISIFGNFIPFLSSNRTHELLNRVHRKSHLYHNSKIYLEIVSRIVLNAIKADIEQGELRLAAELKEMLTEMLDGKSLYYEKAKLNFYAGILEIKKGNINSGTVQAEQFIQFLYSIGEIDQAQGQREYLNLFLLG